MTAAAIDRLIKDTEAREREQARRQMAERRKHVALWRRRTVRAFEHDVLERTCGLCEGEFFDGDVILLQSASAMPIAHPDKPVFHAECLGQAADIADPARSFNRLRNRILETKELFPT